MTFRDFWPHYLRAHRLPGTRALHYFASVLGILAAIEAIAVRQPLIVPVGVAIAYAITISAHWFVEGNRPVFRANPLWWGVAELRMCWLALTGHLKRELGSLAQVRGAPLDRGNADRGRRTGLVGPLALLAISLAGLTAGLIDLSDLSESHETLAYPFIQLGAPITAFAAALLSAGMARIALRQTAGAAESNDAHAHSADEASLRRACLVLIVIGIVAFVGAEVVEHGLATARDLDTGSVLAGLLAMSVLALSQLTGTHAEAEHAAGPNTRGLRVDGRAEFVDLLENLLSLGRRRRILAATLDAGQLHAGDRLIDVGCGTGELAMMAAVMGAGDAVGIDATPDMIALARHGAVESRSQARFEVAVAEALPLPDGAADVATSSFFFHHLPSEVKREALREMWRVLSPGGRLVITDYGRPRGLVGLVASFPMRFNFHEYVRPQLGGELERIIAAEGLGEPENVQVFLGYIRVLRITKPAPRH